MTGRAARRASYPTSPSTLAAAFSACRRKGSSGFQCIGGTPNPQRSGDTRRSERRTAASPAHYVHHCGLPDSRLAFRSSRRCGPQKSHQVPRIGLAWASAWCCRPASAAFSARRAAARSASKAFWYAGSSPCSASRAEPARGNSTSFRISLARPGAQYSRTRSASSASAGAGSGMGRSAECLSWWNVSCRDIGTGDGRSVRAGPERPASYTCAIRRLWTGLVGDGFVR